MKRYKFPSKDKNFFINYNSSPYPITHCHEHWEFTIILKGEMRHKIGGQEHVIRENTLLVIRPDDVHSFHHCSDQELLYINLGVRESALQTMLLILSKNLYDFLLKEPFVEFELSKTTATYFANIFDKFHTSTQDDNANEILLSTIFTSILRELLTCYNKSKQTKNYSPTVTEFIKHMRKPENLILSINDIIKNMNYSHCHIIRLFKKETGITPSQYFLKIKLNYARSLLETTNLSVLDIASTVGFSSLGHFTEVFKKEYSLPPANYRRKWNNYYDSFDEINDNDSKRS